MSAADLVRPSGGAAAPICYVVRLHCKNNRLLIHKGGVHVLPTYYGVYVCGKSLHCSNIKFVIHKEQSLSYHSKTMGLRTW
jgi:hypothetical protein